MKKKNLGFLLLGLCVVLFSGCETVKFPLKNEAYFKDTNLTKKKAVLLPFRAGLYYNTFGIMNNQTLADAKAKQAIEFFADALKESLPKYGYELVGYMPISDYEKPDADDDMKLSITSEIWGEYRAALYSINKNLMTEKGESFDYSVGIRVEELNQFFSPPPDVYIIAMPSGYVLNLTAMDQTALNTVGAIFSLGMTKLFPVSDDTIGLDLALIDAKTGNIFWLNTKSLYGSSMLVDKHVADITKMVLDDLKKDAL